MQQINFYLSLRKANRYAINFSRFCKIVGTLLALIIVSTLGQKLLLFYDSYILNSIFKEQQLIREKSDVLIQSSPKVKAALKIKQNIADLNAFINQTQLLQQTINKNSPYNISPYLVALAKASTPGIWIAEISIKNQAKQIFIQGGVVDPAIMPHFINTIEQQEVFSKVVFSNYKVEHQSGASYANFILSTP